MILEIDGIEFSYRSTPVLKNIKFTLEKGEILTILGNNGAGKSTLLKCINRILEPKKGVIYLEKKNLNKIKREEIAKKMGYVAQMHNSANFKVFDAVLLGRKPFIKWDVSKRDIEIVEKILKKLNLESLALRNLNELSGGELQKVIIGRALAQEPKILLLDEPTNNLDLRNQIEVLNIIREEVKNQNISSIIVLHDINLALRFSDKFLFLKDNTIFAFGGLEIIKEENIEKVYGIPVVIGKLNNLPIVIPA